MTYNIRVPVDPAPFDWNTRRPKVSTIIQQVKPEFLGLQEVVPQMIADVQSDNKHYGFIGRGREADAGGEATPIFYRADLWELDLQDSGTLQISPTPEVVGSNGWNFQWPRILTWGKFSHKKTHKAVYVFNTHFPLKVEEQLLAMNMVVNTIQNRKDRTVPVVLMADFNACMKDAPLELLLSKTNELGLIDVLSQYRQEPFYSFHAFGKTTSDCAIDHIVLSPNIGFSDVKIINSPELLMASDHFPLVTKIKLQ